MIWIIIALLFYLIPVCYSILFIKRSYGKGGYHEGEPFENWLILATFTPLFNIFFASVAFLSSPYADTETNWQKITNWTSPIWGNIGDFFKTKIFGIK